MKKKMVQSVHTAGNINRCKPYTFTYLIHVHITNPYTEITLTFIPSYTNLVGQPVSPIYLVPQLPYIGSQYYLL